MAIDPTDKKIIPDWLRIHRAAMTEPRTPHERAVVGLVTGLAEYAEAHAQSYLTTIGEDYVLGPEFVDACKAVRGLLNGETGRLDCGTIDRFLCELIEIGGGNPDV